MKELLMSEILSAIGDGKYVIKDSLVDTYITNITTSTDEVTHGSVFIGINSGYKYAHIAEEKGAAWCICDREVDNVNNLIVVKDSIRALVNIAKYYRSLFNIPFVAITGSTGKTTTKDMVASVLAEKYNVLKTDGNYNNNIGVPITLFRLEEDHEIAVIEIGMNHEGEILELAEIIKPNIAIITNIGHAHIENLGSRENILKAKMEVMEHLKPDGVLVYNIDDDMLNTINQDDYNREFITIGINNNADYTASNIVKNGLESVEFTIVDNLDNENIEVVVNSPGEHMVYNTLMATACGKHLDVEDNDIINGVKNFRASSSRMDIITLKNGTTVINDAYNANPTSMKSAISVLEDTKNNGRKIVVLGDMKELGHKANELHEKLGERLLEANFDVNILVGKHMKECYKAMKEIKDKDNELKLIHVDEHTDVMPLLEKLQLNETDVVLIKASNSMSFKNIVNQLKE